MKKKRLIPLIGFMFFALFVHGQFTDSLSYDFRDGTIIANGQSADGSLKLSGNYGNNGTTYGMDMKENSEIKIAVTGSSTLRFLGSAYSSLSMIGTADTTGDLGTHPTKVDNDLSDTYDFVYWGDSDTLNFKAIAPGSDVYLPVIEVIPAQAGADASLTMPVKNIIYYFDFRDGSIVPTTTTGTSDISLGLIDILVGASNAYGYNGAQHGSIFKEGNQIVLQVVGNSYIKIGGCTYSNGTISASSTTGDFDITSQPSQTATEFHVDSATVDFLYVGDTGTVTLDFTGTTYVPYIEVVPVPFEVTLNPWVVKSGTITINGIDIDYASGADASSNATVTVSDGTVISATSEVASVYIDLGGSALSAYTPSLTGDIASVDIQGDSLVLTLAGAASNPQSYIIRVTDNSTVIEAEAGKTYIYNFADGSVLPQTSYSALRYSTFITDDGILTMNSNTNTESLKFGFHDNSHGGVFFPGNSFDFIVAGNAAVTFTTCQYGSADDAYFRFTDAEGTPLDSIDATNIGAGAAGTSSFSYTGAKGTITATLLSPAHSAAEIYIHGVTIENAAIIEESNGKTDVWDFGAEALDTSKYNNMLSVDTINSWYADSVTVGSTGNVLPSFSAGVLSWIGGGNDRLRSTNTSLTRYDENLGSVASYTGRVYVNSAANPSRYMSLTLSQDDEVTIIAKTDAGGNINFEYVADPVAQTDEVAIPSDLTELNFVAKESGTYHIYDNQGKPSYYRIYRKDATYVTLTGSVDLSQAAGIPSDYAIRFTNKAGKTWTSAMGSGTYSAKLPAGYTYYLGLINANGYIINNGTSLEVTDTTTSYNISIEKVELYSVTGSITGLGDEISNLELVFDADTAQHKIYMPEPVIDAGAGTYSVQLEPGCKYTISALGVNDFYIPDNTLTIGSADATFNIVFAGKPVYAVTIDATGLTTEQLSKLSLTFTNLYEEGYAYSFSSVSGIGLRDGTYAVSYDSLDTYPVEMGLASNLKVDGAAATKTLAFKPVTNWSFDDKEIPNGTQAYKGLLFTGSVSNEIAKGHLATVPDATIKIPVGPGDKLRITYYYSADFSIDGGNAFTTASNSTSLLEHADYVYSGTEAGYVTITVGAGASKTYFTNISIGGTIDYEPIIYVGADKTYKTINAALEAIGKMDRNSDERVTVMIDPGNYEEMLVISEHNVTFRNAAPKPDIKLSNHGVDISGNAVRVTSYYGHGYNYYSMGGDQKWNADVLQVNKENGYLSYENAGSGTTNGSYWNTTVLISANGFVADDIIFENSFNQYISKKESEDIVVMWESGSKGERPTDYGNTAVQDKSFVERAAAIAIVGADKVILNRCRVIGRQDSFYGSGGSRVVIYKGVMMGGTDYLFGAMTAVFYKSGLAMNTSENNNDVSYLTAAQQGSGRGYLMYECTVTSAIPGTETASAYRSKPGYFGRPWQATTSEVVFYNTTVETTDFTGFEGASLIKPLGWNNSLGGESALMYEYGTVEKSGEDNIPYRAEWATVLDEPTLTDATEITTFNFTKGTDNWDPIPALIAGDTISGDTISDTTSSVHNPVNDPLVSAYGYGSKIYVTGVKSNTQVNIYSINGDLVKSFITGADTSFDFRQGLWIIDLIATEGQKVIKVITH